MKSDITDQGRVVIEGLVFDWEQSNAMMLEVWHWQYGRKSQRVTGRACEAAAREMALQLIADREATASPPQGSLEHPSGGLI